MGDFHFRFVSAGRCLTFSAQAAHRHGAGTTGFVALEWKLKGKLSLVRGRLGFAVLPKLGVVGWASMGLDQWLVVRGADWGRWSRRAWGLRTRSTETPRSTGGAPSRRAPPVVHHLDLFSSQVGLECFDADRMDRLGLENDLHGAVVESSETSSPTEVVLQSSTEVVLQLPLEKREMREVKATL